MRLANIGLRLGMIALLISFTAALPCTSRADEELYRAVGDDSLTTESSQAWGRLEYFDWHEYDGSVSKAKNAGPRISVGVARSYNRDDVTFTPRVGAMVGYTSYQGTLSPPYNNTPIDTYSKSFGFDVGADVGAVYHLPSEATIEPFAGLGWNWWRTDTASWGGPRETWDSVYARGGARGSAILKVREIEFRGYGEVGLKLPLSTENSIKVADHGKGTLKPEGDLSPFAEAGIVRNRWRLGLAYDSWRFRNSDPAQLSDGTPITQRKSHADIFAFTAGYAF